jgi:hypothetical protein
MAIFDRFKKNKKETPGHDQASQNLNLSDPIIKKMVDWIEHPMEFGKKPDAIEIVDKRVLFWPSHKNETCYLLKYVVDNKEYIGFTGPITWSFFDIDLSKVSYDDLYVRYCGWFIAFFTINAENYDQAQEGKNEEKVIDSLHSKGFSDIKTLQKSFIGGNNYYEFIANKDGQKLKVVGIENEMQEYPIHAVLPYYEYIGIGWDPLNI